MNPQPSPYDFIRKGNYTTGTGAFEYWNGTFKEAIVASKDGLPGSPFEKVKTNGVFYEDTTNYGDNARIRLENYDGFKTSSWITFTLKPGWQALFYVKTENNDFFEDYVNADYETGDWNNSDSFTDELREATDQLASAGYPTVWVQDNAEASDSRTVFGMDGDNEDYMSFDIDAESSAVGQTRVRLDGTQYFQNKEHDNEVYITMIWLRKWNPDKVLTVEPEPEPSPEPEPEPDPNNTCPPGFEDNGFGICVPKEDEDDEDDDEDDEDDDKDDVEVSTFAMVALLATIGLIVYVGVKA